MVSIAAGIARYQHSQGSLLTLHRVASSAVWPTLPNRDFYADVEFLDRLLAYLIRKGWKIATLDDVIGCLESGEDGSRLVNFSIDDCYRDTYERVVPLFRKHGVPVTLFVTTGIPDRTLALSRAGLEDILAGHRTVTTAAGRVAVPDQTAKSRLFETLAADWERGDVEQEYADFCALNGADIDALHDKHAISWEMLESFRGDPCVEIGAHTVSHPRMSELSAESALAELVEGRARLESRLGLEVRHFAFPYGRPGDCDERDFGLAQQAGYVSASTTRRGIVKPGQDKFSLPRNTLNGARASIAYVEAKISGLTGIAAGLLKTA